MFLRLGAADQDEFGGDLGARAERADADIAARQLLRHDAHRHLAEPHAAIGLGDGEAEDAHGAQARDDLERDIGVGAMPALGVGYDLGVGESAHLAADRLEGLVKAGVADRAFPRLRDQGGEGGAVFAGVALGDQGLDGLVAKRRDVLEPRPKSARRTISPWFIGMPLKIWARYSPSPIRVRSCSVSPKRPSSLHALA